MVRGVNISKRAVMSKEYIISFSFDFSSYICNFLCVLNIINKPVLFQHFPSHEQKYKDVFFDSVYRHTYLLTAESGPD